MTPALPATTRSTAIRKAIITCAVTGSIHTPTMSPYLPITPDEIAQSAIEAAEAGASILHLHARRPNDGYPTPDPEVFMQFLPRIKAATDAVINITTGGGHNMTVEQRLAAPLAAQPEMCSCNMGSMNFGLYPILEKFTQWKYDWEPKYLEMTRDFIFRNTFKDIETIVQRLGTGCGTRFEFECYDIGHLYTLHHFLERKVIKPPIFVQTIFGILGGIGAEIENLVHMRRTADRLFGNDYHWSILAAGKAQFNLVTTGAIMGGHARVGLEDNLYLAKGVLAKSNAEMVRKIRGLLESLSLEIATPDDVRSMLALKGKNNVAF
ncbi:MAG: 3-keto-5-aminohexanoate cleavage protein [Planctomycetota bacterium]|nr:3-keto-5-aminohexanoate cleavage protein [Planctomycetota bacterium]MDA1212044.1 3-keto-5-aminohexanoate cleavage protein [Planctomycetota bacterium]